MRGQELRAQLDRDKAAAAVDEAPRPMLGMHIRRGDSCLDSLKRGRVCSHGAEYAKEAAELIQRYGFRSVYVASDSEDALRELQTALAEADKAEALWRGGGEQEKAESQTGEQSARGRAGAQNGGPGRRAQNAGQRAHTRHKMTRAPRAPREAHNHSAQARSLTLTLYGTLTQRSLSSH